MSKKIWIAGVIALALLIGSAAVAAAAPAADPPNPPGPRGGPGRGPGWPPHLSGEILSVGDDQFTMQGPWGSEVTVEVDEFTSYLGSLESFADLEVGAEVAVAGHRGGEGGLVARVVVLREELPMGTQIGGEVTATSGTTLTIETRRGESFFFNMTSATEFLSRENAVQGLADIEVGDHVMVLFEQASNGTLSANLVIVAGPPPSN
ncbi:MAG: DUF5666 domain-containing protein [Anaerolineales bacterium]